MAPLQEPHLGPNFLWIWKNNNKLSKKIMLFFLCLLASRMLRDFDISVPLKCYRINNNRFFYFLDRLRVKHWAYNYELQTLMNFHYCDLSFCITNNVYDCDKMNIIMISLWRVKSYIHLDLECIFQPTQKVVLIFYPRYSLHLLLVRNHLILEMIQN